FARGAGDEADRGRVQGQGEDCVQAAAAAVPRQGPPGGRGGAGRQRTGQVLADARQAVREPAGAGPAIAGEIRRGAGPEHDEVQGGARLGQVQGEGRRGRQGGRGRGRHRNADVLHQRNEGRRRPAVRVLQVDDRRRAEGQGLA